MNVLVIGGARSGISVSKLLTLHNYNVYLTDQKQIDNKSELEELGIKVYDLGHPDFLKDIKYDFIVKNPGIPYQVPFVKYFNDLGIKIYNETQIASQYTKNYQYASITGTNGKTTTTKILADLLAYKNNKSAYAGNIGVPLSEVVLKHGDCEMDVAVEISAFQLLGCDTYRPIVSVCTNLTPDHLDYFKSEEDYYNAKMLVYKNQKDDDWFLKNLDDDNIVKYATDVNCKTITYSLDSTKVCDSNLVDGQIMLFDMVLFDSNDCKLVGRHNLSNCQVAAIMAFKMGVSLNDIKKGIQDFKGVEHRIEYIKQINNVKYYNDSKGTNCDATITALNAFDQSVILIAGGYDKHTGFNELIPYFDKIKEMIVYGETKYQLKILYPKAIVVDDLKQAFDQSIIVAKDNDVVLFSPLCASYDQFDSYEQRGDIFKQYVNEYLSK